MMRLSPILPALLVLAACSSETPDADKVRAEAAKLVKQEPGLYRSTTTLLAYAIPGARPQEVTAAAERMKGVEPQVAQVCLTPEEAAKGFEPFIASLQQGDCAMEEFTADAGELAARFTCKGVGGIVTNTQLSGTATSTRANLVVETEARGNALPGGVEQKTIDIAMERIGDCPQTAEPGLTETRQP